MVGVFNMQEGGLLDEETMEAINKRTIELLERQLQLQSH